MTTAVFQDGVSGYSGTRDSWINSSTPSANEGAKDELDVGNTWYNSIFRSLIKFDLSSLSGVTSVSSATINLLCYGTASGTFTISAARLLRDWGEGDNTGANADAGECCWYAAKSGTTAWATGGADSQGNDRNAFGTGVSAPSVASWLTIDVTDDVNDMLVNATANYGWVLCQVTENGDARQLRQFRSRENATASNHPYISIDYSTKSCALTGTITASVTEADVVTGGKTIILTLTGDTWLTAAGGLFDAQRQNIIDGIDSAQAEGTGWDAVVKAGLAVTDVVRTSDTVVTITLPAFASYNITSTETITATVPLTATTTTLSDIVASPTFTVSPVASGPSNLKTLDTNAKANIKTIDGAPIANVKSVDSIT